MPRARFPMLSACSYSHAARAKTICAATVTFGMRNALQEALLPRQGMPEQGVPDNPAGWHPRRDSRITVQCAAETGRCGALVVSLIPADRADSARRFRGGRARRHTLASLMSCIPSLSSTSQVPHVAASAPDTRRLPARSVRRPRWRSG